MIYQTSLLYTSKQTLLIGERTSLVPLWIPLWVLARRILIRRVLPLRRVLHSLRRRHVPLGRAVPWLLISDGSESSA
jgi:hypothetical protein